MAFAGQDEKVETLVGLDQGVDNLHGARRIDVFIEFAHHEQ